jgi:hypothetical protein
VVHQHQQLLKQQQLQPPATAAATDTAAATARTTTRITTPITTITTATTPTVTSTNQHYALSYWGLIFTPGTSILYSLRINLSGKEQGGY